MVISNMSIIINQLCTKKLKKNPSAIVSRIAPNFYKTASVMTLT